MDPKPLPTHTEDLDIPQGEFFTNVFDWAEGSMLFPPKATLFRTMKDISGGNGIVGEPQTATAGKGELILELVVSELRRIVEELATNQ